MQRGRGKTEGIGPTKKCFLRESAAPKGDRYNLMLRRGRLPCGSDHSLNLSGQRIRSQPGRPFSKVLLLKSLFLESGPGTKAKWRCRSTAPGAKGERVVRRTASGRAVLPLVCTKGGVSRQQRRRTGAFDTGLSALSVPDPDARWTGQGRWGGGCCATIAAGFFCGFSGAGRPHAKVAKLADAPDLGSGGAIRGGSSPPFRTISSNP